jgi:non-reducing end alpha-L-arabinofuranosidase
MKSKKNKRINMKKKSRFLTILALALILPVAMIMMMAMSGVGHNAAPVRPEGPCDIYAAAGTPCVAAHSTTRALYKSYNGPLYQVRRQSDGKTLDIGLARSGEGDPGGYADASAQDAFCANTVCWITTLYDQSGKGNHLTQVPPGTFKGTEKGAFNTLPIADMAPITISGHKAYGVYIMPGMGLRNNNATDIAINDEPEGIYYVVDGTHYDSGCCFDYGNSSTNGRAVGTGTMETTYFGTATAWGSGDGTGPWIMADMEAGLFSGYNAKKNAGSPTIDSWRFVTAVVDGGGGNKWDLRGGNAQKGGLTTFYSGVRPGSPTSNAYYPMHKQGGILLGTGGDNGNGSSGTFYEGVMTTGYPTEVTTDAVQSNIVAAKYDVQMMSLSRPTTFTPSSVQELTETFTNTTGASVNGVKLSISVPKGWTSMVSGTTETSKTFIAKVEPGTSVSTTFKITASEKTGAGFITGKAEWKNAAAGGIQVETISQRVRNVIPVKINEIRFSTSTNATNQFIELYNSSTSTVDISNWTLINTQSQWAPVKAATIPVGTKLAGRAYYLLGLSNSGLAAPAIKGATIINVRSITGFEVGQKIDIDGETHSIKGIGTAASVVTTLFIPVSTGPWLTIPAGSTNLPVTSAAGFEVGQKIGIEIGGNYEIATVTTVGKAATQTTLSAAVTVGATSIKVAANSNMTVGDVLTVGTGAQKELVTIRRIVNIVEAPIGRPGPGSVGGGGELELTTPVRFDHMSGVDVSDAGTGISFSPATRFKHMSGEVLQALGSGITLDGPLVRNHEYGAPVVNPLVTTEGYQGPPVPNQWYGGPLSASAGSIALMDASGVVIVDAMVYGSQQGNSSANGPVTSPDIATLEGDQSQGGCIVVVPRASSGAGISRGRFPDGFDTDNNCTDFLMQSASYLSAASAAGATNIKLANVADLNVGQKIIIDMGTNSETAVIMTVGTAGATTVGTSTTVGATVIPVVSAANFTAGQTITIDSGVNLETVVIASVTGAPRGGQGGAPGALRGSASITITTPLTIAHEVGAQISGTGITLTTPLIRAHDNGVQVASYLPTPGAPNQYSRKP